MFQADGDPSNNALRRICKTEYFSWLRMRQWKDLVSQLRQMCKELKFKVGDPLPASRPGLEIRQLPLNQQAAHSLCCAWDADGIHKSMLAGLLSMMGMQVVREPKASDFAGLTGSARARAMKRAQKQSKNDYQGARGTRFALFPASAVAKKTPSWVMSTELVETSRLWARYSAAIDPAWAEPLAGQLTRTTYAEPHWSGSRGSAVATARVLLYGLPIVQDRAVQWGRINPLEARDFLIRQGLVEGDIQQRFSYDDFVGKNRDILEDAADDASRTRQLADTVSDEDLFDFYNAVIPNDVTSVADLAKWWKSEHDRQPNLLDFDPAKVERLASSDSVSLDDYPDHWHTTGSDGQPIDLRLSYVYDPADPADGVTVHVPLKALSRITPDQFTWNVPGLLDELILSMIKALPKQLRVQFVPAPDAARAIRDWIDEHYPDLPGSGSQQKPNLPPVDEDGTTVGWPDLAHVFTKAAIATKGAQIHRSVGAGTGRASFPVSQSHVLGGAATAGRQAPSWTPACARPHQGAGCVQGSEGAATQVRRAGGGVGPVKWSRSRPIRLENRASWSVRRTCCIRRVPPPSPGPRCSGVAHWMRCGCRPNAFRRAGWVPRR